MKLKLILMRLVVIGLFVFTALTAAGANDLYKGKTIRFVVGPALGARCVGAVANLSRVVTIPGLAIYGAQDV